MTNPHSIPHFSVETNPPKVLAHLPAKNGSSNGKEIVELHPLWLRERCQDPTNLDPLTQQRTYDPHQLPEDLALTEARSEAEQRIFLSFSDGYQGTYNTIEFVRDFDNYDGCPTPLSWDASLNPKPTASWNALDDDKAMLEALENFLTYGFLIVTDTSTEKNSILQLAAKFGFVRATNFGDYFEVYSRPDGNDLAYTARALFPHTDNPYRNPVPGIQLLHCLVNETSGGLSTLVDSVEIANIVRREDPEGFHLLSTIPLRYRFIDKDTELIDRSPLISLNTDGEVDGISYNSKVDFLPPALSHAQTLAYHRARKHLISLFKDPRFELQFLLQKGELMMFDNNRVLHGRTSFDPNEGMRQLQGCYIDRDAPRSLYRVLSRRLAS